jgi:hypothetical protein
MYLFKYLGGHHGLNRMVVGFIKLPMQSVLGPEWLNELRSWIT